MSDRENYFVLDQPPRGRSRRTTCSAASTTSTRSSASAPFGRKPNSRSTRRPRRHRDLLRRRVASYGFHEDGLLSAVRLSEELLGRDPWAARRSRRCLGSNGLRRQACGAVQARRRWLERSLLSPVRPSRRDTLDHPDKHPRGSET